MNTYARKKVCIVGIYVGLLLSPALSLAQAQQSPFSTGANALVDFALTIATPVGILIVVGIAIAAAVGRVSLGGAIAGIVAIAAVFGAPQIITWIRDMFAV